MKPAWLLALAVSAPLAAVAAGPINVTGVYRSNWDEVRLVQHGTRVTGVCCGGGTIDGELDGHILRYRWHEPRGAGDGIGIWRVDGDRLDGTWGRAKVDDGGSWILDKIVYPARTVSAHDRPARPAAASTSIRSRRRCACITYRRAS